MTVVAKPEREEKGCDVTVGCEWSSRSAARNWISKLFIRCIQLLNKLKQANIMMKSCLYYIPRETRPRNSAESILHRDQIIIECAKESLIAHWQ